MSSLIGILVDVSDSMRNSVSDRVEAEGGSWAKFLLKEVNKLIKDDVSSSNQTFALAFGRLFDPEVFDLLSTLDKANEEQSFIDDLKSRKSQKEIINKVLDSLERNGAVSVRTCVKMEILTEVFDATTAAAILYCMERNSYFTQMFVHECLLRECRSRPTLGSVVKEYWPTLLGAAAFAATVATPGFGAITTYAAGTYIAQATKNMAKDYSIKNALEKGKLLLAETRTVRRVTVNKLAIMSVQSAFKILHDSIADQVTVQLIDEITKTVEPNIYRRNPLIQAMRHSEEFFSDPQFANHQKHLLILSDGQRADGWYPHQKLSDLGVNIMRCAITDQRLSEGENLDTSKFTLRRSPTSTTQKIPRTLHEKRGWEVDNDNVETGNSQEGMFFNIPNL